MNTDKFPVKCEVTVKWSDGTKEARITGYGVEIIGILYPREFTVIANLMHAVKDIVRDLQKGTQDEPNS